MCERIEVNEKSLKSILIVYDYADMNGGAAKVAIKTAIEISKNEKFKVYYYAATGPVCDELKNSRVETICLDFLDINKDFRLKAIKNGIWNSKAKKQFSFFLNRFSPEDTVVHFHGWSRALSSSVIYEAIRKKFTCFITLHDYFSVCPNGGFYNYKTHKICHIPPMSFKCIFCNCDKRNFLQKSWRCCRQIVQDFFVRYEKNIIFISISNLNENLVKPFVESENFYRLENPVDFSGDKICKIEEANTFLFVGRVSEEKGVDVFCMAVKRLIDSGKKVNGIVVGDGVQKEELSKIYKEIKFIGWKTPEEVKKYMRESRMLILPSKWYEGAPLTIIEAMSVGLPCIVSDCTSAVELVIDGVNGFVFHTGNVSSLAEKMLLSLENDTVLRFQEEIFSKFDLNKYRSSVYINRLLEIYEERL